MPKKDQKILIATGGTGGHVFPSISLIDFIKQEYHIEVTTDKRGLKFLKNLENTRINIIDTNTIFEKNFFKFLTRILILTFSFFKSIFLVIKLKPKLVIGMGGYSSFPICLAAYFLKIPIIIYENNLVIGRANKFLLPFVKKILIANKFVKGISPKYKEKIYFTGYFLRSNIFQIEKNHDEIERKGSLSVLIIGGSQSAQIFSEALPLVLKKCYLNDIKFKIYQQCHDKQKLQLENFYKKLNFNFELFSFSESLLDYYKQADLAITRAGASSVAELLNLRIPFIAIPLPSSADNHQYENASHFEKKGYCFLLEERFIHDKLFKILYDLNHDRQKLLSLKKNMGKHSDEDSLLRANEIIKKILNV